MIVEHGKTSVGHGYESKLRNCNFQNSLSSNWTLKTYYLIFWLIISQVKLKFVQFPDVISIGSRLFFRNGRTKGMGTVVGIVKIPSKIRTSGSGGTPAKSDLVLDELNWLNSSGRSYFVLAEILSRSEFKIKVAHAHVILLHFYA